MIRDLKQIVFSPSCLAAIALLAVCIFFAPDLVQLHVFSKQTLLEKLVSQRNLLVSGYLRAWFLRIYIVLGYLLVPLLLVTSGFTNRRFHRQKLLLALRGIPPQTLFVPRFLASVIVMTFLSLVSHLSVFILFHKTVTVFVTPIYIAVAYLSTLASLFTVSFMIMISVIVRNTFSSLFLGVVLTTTLQLPLFLNHPLAASLKFLSPYYYATYILRYGPGDMNRFIMAASILFICILIPYVISMIILGKPERVEEESVTL